MASEKVTSLDVAKRAGVSQSAVSRVFTPGASASKKTVEKVRQAAEELDYRPNMLARSLITGKSRIIGVVVAYLENQFYPEAIEKLSNALQAEGYHVLMFMASNNAENVDEVLRQIIDYQVDGIILASVSMSSGLAAQCHEAGIPVVLFNRRHNDDSMSSVTSDNVDGGRKIAEFLLAGGHQKIGYIAGWEGASTQQDREAGFVRALHDAGQQLHARGVGDFKAELAAQAAREMFATEDRPDAVFVANDHMAFAVMDVLRFELGLKIPQDVSVVGYDDVQPAAWPAYALTTVRQRANRMVDQTAALLLAQINGAVPSDQQHQIIGPLIVRKSARLPVRK